LARVPFRPIQDNALTRDLNRHPSRLQLWWVTLFIVVALMLGPEIYRGSLCPASAGLELMA
jgi:hypothetical protein